MDSECLEERLRLIVPENLLDIDSNVLEFGESTLQNETAESRIWKTNRTTQNIYFDHNLYIRGVIRKLLELVGKEGREYIRLLDIGCGERLFSPNRGIIFDFHGFYDAFVWTLPRPKIHIITFPYLPVLEFGMDNGNFLNPIADETGLFRIDFTNDEHRELFAQNIPLGYFDFILATGFFGIENTANSSEHIPPTRENLSWVKQFLNKRHGIFLLTIYDPKLETQYFEGITKEYSKIERWSCTDYEIEAFQGHRTYVSYALRLNPFNWDKLARSRLRELGRKNPSLYCDPHNPQTHLFLYS